MPLPSCPTRNERTGQALPAMLVAASDALERVQKLCGTSHAIGAEIQLKLESAYLLVEVARQTLRGIDP